MGDSVSSCKNALYISILTKCKQLCNNNTSDVQTVLNSYLADFSYFNGYVISEADHIVFEELVKNGDLGSESKFPHLFRWVHHMRVCRQGGGGSCRGNFSVRTLPSACTFDLVGMMHG